MGYLNGGTLEDRMNSFLYPFWNTASIKEALQAFYKEEKEKMSPAIMGCDPQEDCRFTALSDYFYRNGIALACHAQLAIADSLLSRYLKKNAERTGSMAPETAAMGIRIYDSVTSTLKKHTSNSIKNDLLLQCIENRK